MMILYHSIFILLIGFTGYAVYASWFKDSARKDFEKRKQRFSLIPLWPKSLAGYTLLYRGMLIVALAAALFLYISALIVVYG
jgi:hypothetical protein